MYTFSAFELDVSPTEWSIQFICTHRSSPDLHNGQQVHPSFVNVETIMSSGLTSVESADVLMFREVRIMSIRVRMFDIEMRVLCVFEGNAHLDGNGAELNG